jgi:hypothetical protein
MPKLSEATQQRVSSMLDTATGELARQPTFDAAAQVVTDALYTAFSGSCVLARIFVTTPLEILPAGMASWVQNLAAAKGVAGGLTPQTQVLALAGSSGTRPEWRGRAGSKGHVGIPLISASFIDSIPMMARLLGSLGRGLTWMDTKDAGQLVKSMSRLSGRFYVPDASRTTDYRGRNVISDQTFVAENNIVTVFGLANASVLPTGALMTLIVFTSEALTEPHADLFGATLPRLRSLTVDLMGPGKLFAA